MKKWLVLFLALALIVPLSALAAEKKPANEYPIVFEAGEKKIDCVLKTSSDSFGFYDTNIGSITTKITNIAKISFVKSYSHYDHIVNVTLKNGDELTNGRFNKEGIISITSPLYGEIGITTYPAVVYFSQSAISGTSPSFTKVDRIVLKNGDSVSGTILTASFKLKTSYGELEFKSNDIKTINLEGGGNNVDVVILRVGDKMSGVVLNTTIKIKMTNGTEITVEKDKVKEIIFKE